MYARVANKLSQLVENVRRVSVDVDEKRQLLNIAMTDRHNTEHVASALSDGTLRFLALTVMEADPNSHRLLCLEEPENGMHPTRIKAVIELLRDLAVDPTEPVDADNPLRQVIINTHSPAVVAYVDPDSLLLAHSAPTPWNEADSTRLSIRDLAATWRDKTQGTDGTITKNDLLAFLDPMSVLGPASSNGERAKRVVDREDMQLDLFNN
ncbi:MAG: ATP-binding protein [Bryobacterales bacterium]|nr:ATP-binding protein [Bryobacterales bacterium]